MIHRFSKNFRYCFQIIESSKNNLIKKVKSLAVPKGSILELRLDYMLYTGMDIENVVKIVNDIKKMRRNVKILATIRTISEGSKLDLSREKYFYFIRELCVNSNVDYIDCEYKFYKIDKQYYDNLFKKCSKKVILSIHFFNRVFDAMQYTNIVSEMLDSKSHFIKFAMRAYTREDLFTFMLTMHKLSEKVKEYRKEPIFIAMGEVGKLSRLWPEFTGTKIVFMNAYGMYNKDLGLMGLNYYEKKRKLLAKGFKN